MQYVITPYQGIEAAVPENVEIVYEVGCHCKPTDSPRPFRVLRELRFNTATRLIPQLDGLITVSPEADCESGYTVDFYNGVKGEEDVNKISSTTPYRQHPSQVQ